MFRSSGAYKLQSRYREEGRDYYTTRDIDW
uniref:Uncharacterized protein n=1 Tax=Arundo donax TaxID=35708 RepID=A0A0A9CWM1_ARUDO